MAGAAGSGRGRDRDDTSSPVLITRARQSYEEDHAARVRRYLVTMSVRIPALVLAAVAYSIWHNGWISLAIIIGSIPIPWIAVIRANDGPPKPKNAPRPYAGGSASPYLALPGATSGPAGHAGSTAYSPGPGPQGGGSRGGDGHIVIDAEE